MLRRVKATRFLNQCRISQSKTVGGLSDRQRTELVALFDELVERTRALAGRRTAEVSA